MAKKLPGRERPNQQSTNSHPPQGHAQRVRPRGWWPWGGQSAGARMSRGVSRRRRQRLIVGVVALALVLGTAVVIRVVSNRQVALHLQGTVDNYYTRGTAGAPVVVKEFSNYT